MQDRVPLYPGRVTLNPVAGQANTYDMVRADQPTQEGTPLNKATLLKDVTASILGLPNTAVPDDAFLALIIGVGTYGYRVKIQLADGTPVAGATVSGITALTGSTLVSGTDGIVLGKSTSKTVTIGCTSPYIDQAPPTIQSVTATGRITDVTLTLTSITDTITILDSKTVKVSTIAKTMDVTAVGGGGGGGDWLGGGGGGGNIAHALNVDLSSTDIQIIIGAGGSPGSSAQSASIEQKRGHPGGTTHVKFGDTANSIVSATGGGGGGYDNYSYNSPGGSSLNGGRGGNGAPNINSSGASGSACVVHIFDDPNLPIAGSGGGGGGSSNQNASPGEGGSPNGGRGAGYTNDGYAGVRPGGGGGGGGGAKLRPGGYGASGGAHLRFHF